ncbi:hypothetical protein N5V81_12795 [Escherichia coli]|nr:hypothetical protein [Escherichia coli]
MLEGNMLSPVSDQAPHNLKRNILFMLLSGGYYLEMPWKDSGLNSGQWKARMLPLHYGYIGWVYAYTRTSLPASRPVTLSSDTTTLRRKCISVRK